MTAINVEKLLQPVTEAAPCGEDLEYDPAFQTLERSATIDGSESMVEKKGDKPPDPPKWKEVAKQAETILGQTKNLRAAMLLTKARLDTHGVVGLADGIALMKGLLTNYWDDVYPLLDADDANDPTMRINSLHDLTDVDGVVGQLRLVPIVKAKLAGNYSLRDVRIANGDLPAPGGSEPPETGIINAAFQETDLDELKAASESVTQAIADLNAIEGYLTEKVGATNNTLTVKPLVDELIGIGKIYAEQLTARGVDVEPVGGAEAGDASAASRVSGEIMSREDAIRMIDKISEYFRRNEPSSPVPMLLQRARGLIAKDFMEILKDLTPDAISQAQMYSQPRDND